MVTGGDAGAVAFVEEAVDWIPNKLEVMSIVGGVEESKLSLVSLSSC